MKNPAPKLVVALAFLVSSLAPVARADSLTNNFTTPMNYLASGIAGETNWDGVYMRFGDITGGGAGGNGAGTPSIANANVTFPGLLTVQSLGGDWAGAGDDGFFLWKLVAGDFDVSVQSTPPYDARGNNFNGLMVRAYHTNNSGAPYSASLGNNSENFLLLWRFNQFNLDGQIRQATNSADIQNSFAGSNAETNSTRYLRITRVNDTFTFYIKTNVFDPWVMVTNAGAGGGYVQANASVTRADWSGLPVQVGIAHAPFSTANRIAYFTDFQLTSTNVDFPAMPPGPSNIVTSDVSSNSVNITWTTNGGDGSLVMIRANGPLIANPIQHKDYAYDTNFATAPLLSASNNRIVYVGPATNIIVSGLGGSNNTYTVGVYSYSGSPAVYNTAGPATNSFIGPGRVAGVSFVVNPTAIPRGGLSVATVTATYNSGDSYDVSSDPSTVWTSTDTGVLLAGNGVLTGLTNGTSTVTATYTGVTGTNVVTVVDPVFVDDFNTSRDYATNGVAGSPWDGVYLRAGDVPLQGAPNRGTLPGNTSIANANMTSNGVLQVTHNQTGWEGNENDGFLLYKYVPGDFQVSVHIVAYNNQAFHFPGLQARLFNTTNGCPDAPAGTANGTNPFGRENAIRWMRFDEFGISTSARLNLNGANNTVRDNFDSDGTAFWLLMRRLNSTNFTFYKRANPTDPWVAVPGNTLNMAQALGRRMQVGLTGSTFDSGANYRTVWFDDFMLDAAGIAPGTPPAAASNLTFVANLDGTLTLNWNPAVPSDGSLVVMRSGGPVSAHPLDGTTYTASAGFGLGSNLGASNYVVYIGTGSSVTVSNLIPGRIYYAGVYAFAGAGPALAYNRNGTYTNQLAIGTVQTLTFSLPRGNSMARGGIVPFSSRAIYSGGITNDVSSQVTVFSSPDSNVVGAGGVLTGVTNGAINVSITFGGKTNSATVVVHDPTYSDEFEVNHDYVLNRQTNSIWNGVYLNDGDLPGSVNGGEAGVTSGADANVSSNGVLTVTNASGGWEFTEDDGFFLFKYAPSDFQMAVQITAFEAAAFNNPGLMARSFNEDGGANTNNGAGEDWISWTRFDQFGTGTYARNAVNGGTARNQQPIGDGEYYLLMVRQDSTNFLFYQRTNFTDAWHPAPSGVTYSAPDHAGRAMQVGLIVPTFNNTGVPRYTQFDHFMLDVTPPRIEAYVSGGNITLSWPAAPTYVLQSSPTINPTSWLPVVGTPTFNNGRYELTLPASSAQYFFRLVE